MVGMPELGPLGVDAGGGSPFSEAQAGVLVGADEAPKFEVVVARQSLEPAPEVTPQHGHTADQHRVRWHAVDGHCQVVEGRGTHEVLPEPGPKPPGPDALLARALWAQMNEANGLEIDALGDPAEHAGPVAVDAVPHDLAYEAADLLEAGDPIKFGHAHRHLVSADLRYQRAALRVDEPWLTGGGPNARIALHPLHQQLEVANWQVQIHIQLAQVIEE